MATTSNTSDQDTFKYIQLIKCISPTDEQRNDPEYIPQLEMDANAKNILAEGFESPITILVYMGNLGAGKSKLASLTVASLIKNNAIQSSSTFKSGDDPRGITHGVWMCSQPLKNPNKRRGSILILDCEGMGGNDVKMNNNLYLFCMIVSSVLAIVLRPARIDREQCDRLYEELCRFQHMRSPCILPSTWLVPLELPVLKCNDQVASSDQWMEKIFTVDETSTTLATTQQQNLQTKYNFIRKTLPNIDVANITYLPHVLKTNSMTLSMMKTTLNDSSCKHYYESLNEMLKKFLNTQGKQLPGSNSIPILLVRPAELALFMSDLVDVINQARKPNPDELIGRCLLKRFEDEIVKKTEAEFQKDFLSTAKKYAREKIENQDTAFEPNEIENMLQSERECLIGHYISKMISSAEEQIYGSNSILLSSESFQECLSKARIQLRSYRKPDELFNKLRKIYQVCKDQAAEEKKNLTFSEKTEKNAETREKLKRLISEETDEQIKSIADRICREEMINSAIKEAELQCEVEKCSQCHRQAGIISIIHQCNLLRQGNFYRYDETRMVCDACRKLMKINFESICCTSCGHIRPVKKYIN